MSQNDILVHLVKHHKSFRMKSNDRIDVCVLKCDILVLLSTSSHGKSEIDHEILKYLCHQLTNTQSQFNPDVKSAILKALFRLPKTEEVKLNLKVTFSHNFFGPQFRDLQNRVNWPKIRLLMKIFNF